MLNVSPEKIIFLQLIDFLQFIVNCYMHPLHVELVGEEHQYHNLQTLIIVKIYVLL